MGLSDKELRLTRGGQRPVADSQRFLRRSAASPASTYRAVAQAIGRILAQPGMIPWTRGCPGSESFPMTDVTQILSDTEQGDTQASGQLFPLVHDELWKLAASKMAQLSAP